MSDAILSPTDSEEALSQVYLAAVAAGAGYTIARQNFDRDGVDFQIRAGGQMRPSLDLQLKATVNVTETTPGLFRYPLKRRNYDLLREATMVPRILVVMDIPRRPEDRLECSPSASSGAALIGPTWPISRRRPMWKASRHRSSVGTGSTPPGFGP